LVYLQHFSEISVILRRTETVKLVKIGRLRWLGHLFRMQKLDPFRKLTLFKPEGNRRVGKPNVRWLESVEEDLKKWARGTGGVSSRTEKSGGQFLKRLISTKDCNARRRRRRKTERNINTYVLFHQVNCPLLLSGYNKT